MCKNLNFPFGCVLNVNYVPPFVNYIKKVYAPLICYKLITDKYDDYYDNDYYDGIKERYCSDGCELCEKIDPFIFSSPEHWLSKIILNVYLNSIDEDIDYKIDCNYHKLCLTEILIILHVLNNNLPNLNTIKNEYKVSFNFEKSINIVFDSKSFDLMIHSIIKRKDIINNTISLKISYEKIINDIDCKNDVNYKNDIDYWDDIDYWGDK